MKYSLFIGRYQVPGLHEGHKKLIQSVLDEGKNVCIAVRDVKQNDKNPYTCWDIQSKIMEQAYSFGWHGRVICKVIPDIEEVCYGRDVGYGIRQIRLDDKTEGISGTEIRNAKSNSEKSQLESDSGRHDDVHSDAFNRGDCHSSGDRSSGRDDKASAVLPSRESVGK